MSIANLPKAFKIRSGLQVIIGGHVVVAGLALYVGNESFYEHIAMPVCRMLGAETAHRLAVQAAKYGLVPKDRSPDQPILHSSIFGQPLRNPVGLAAGFDKHAEGVDGLLAMGFGAVEIGSVTPQPQNGNSKPRVFRLTKDRGIINRYGFNSEGHSVVLERLKLRLLTKKGMIIPDDRNSLNENFPSPDRPQIKPVYKAGLEGLVGVNLGKNKDSKDGVADFVAGVKIFSAVADYLVVNVSSPNTPGLRDMQAREQLKQLINKVVESRSLLPVEEQRPLVVKISPDLTEKERIDIAAVVYHPNSGVDGIIVSNTTISRPDTLSLHKNVSETGGLSGQPLKNLSTQCIRDMYKLTHGRVPIIGVGGISSGQDAYEKIRAGATMVQIMTSLTYSGPPIVSKIKRELAQILKDEGFSNVSEAVGAEFHR